MVCPSQLRQGLFVVGAVDNIDHDPSTTFRSSFHGTGISITQFPTANNLGVEIEPVATVASQQIALPPSYSIVPAVALSQSKAEVPQKTCSDALSSSLLEDATKKEMLWLKSSMELLNYSFDDYKPLTWASYHAHLQPPVTDPPSISAMLPLFPDKLIPQL